MSTTRSNLVKQLLRVTGWEWVASKILSRADEGHVDIVEARCLTALAARAPTSRPIIEIGTLFGVSTRALFVGKPRETPLISVDNYSWNPLLLSHKGHRRYTMRRWAQVPEHYHVKLLDVDRTEFYADYAGPAPFMVFLDAIHTYEATRIDLQWAVGAGADLICSHDYRDEWPGVVRAVDEVGGIDLLVGHMAVQALSQSGREALLAIREGL